MKVLFTQGRQVSLYHGAPARAHVTLARLPWSSHFYHRACVRHQTAFLWKKTTSPQSLQPAQIETMWAPQLSMTNSFFPSPSSKCGRGECVLGQGRGFIGILSLPNLTTKQLHKEPSLPTDYFLFPSPSTNAGQGERELASRKGGQRCLVVRLGQDKIPIKISVELACTLLALPRGSFAASKQDIQ